MPSEFTSQKETALFQPEHVRRQFPIFEREVAWLDNAATTQRPERVLRAMDEFNRRHNANTRRSVHRLGAEATAAYEGAREVVARFIGGESPAEVIFTPGTTVGINIVANSLAHGGIGPGDEVWISAQEHHGNWVPWLKATQTLGAHLRIIPLLPDGHLDLARFQEGLAGGRVRWVALTWVSNVLGFENDVRAFCAAAHGAGARVLVDACAVDDQS